MIHRNLTIEEECFEVRLVKQAEELIEHEVQSVGPDTTVSEVEALMSGHGIGGVPVVDHENVVIGIVSRRDVRAIVNRRGKESIRAIMTPSPITANEAFTMEDALETMYANKVERLPVTQPSGRSTTTGPWP